MKNEIVKVHDVDIVCPFDEEQHFVAVKSVCQALGIDFAAQTRRLQLDPILSSVVANMATTGADGKQYKMTCIPLRYVFGWLFSIDHTKVKEEARESLLTYKKICYDTLYDRFVKTESERNEVLLRKAHIKNQIDVIERKLAEDNEDYKELMDLRAELMRTGKSIKEIDSKFVEQQLSLFELSD